MSRRRLAILAAVVAAALLAVYVYLVFSNAWAQKTGGVGLRQMARPYPAECAGFVDLHRGSGNAGLGAELALQPRTFVLDISLLEKAPACLGFSVLAAAGQGPEANYRLVFVDSKGDVVIEMKALYYQPGSR